MELPVNFTIQAQEVLGAAREEARRLGRGHVGTEHLLLALSNLPDSPSAAAVRKGGVDIERLRKSVADIGGRRSAGRALPKTTANTAIYTQLLQRVLVASAVESKAFNHPLIGVDHLWLGLLRRPDDKMRGLLARLKVDGELVRAEALATLRPVQAVLADPPGTEDFAGGELSQQPAGGGRPTGEGTGSAASAARQGGRQPSMLATFGRDLTEAARQGKLDPVVGREKEIERLTGILGLRIKNNAVLVGEAGVGKTAVAEGLAQTMVLGAVPEFLKDKRLIQINTTSMVAGTKYRGEFEQRMSALLAEVKRAPDVILFIDEIHLLMGAGRAEGSADAANIMKPALARGELRCIGATTLDEYNTHIEKDAALARRFQKILVAPPSVTDTIVILRRLRLLHETHHRVQITDAAIDAAAKLADRYIMDRFMPDKAIDLMDEAGGHARSLAAKGATEIITLKADIEAARTSVAQALAGGNPVKASEHRKEELRLTDRLNVARQATASARPVVTEETVAAVLSRITKIPLGKIERTEGSRLLNMEGHFQENLIGQDPATVAVAQALRRARTGLRAPNRPIGSLMFLGPTGVGKTELARQVAVEFCGGTDALIQINMSEYMEAHSVSSLIGAPNGYVDSDRGGILTEAVRRRPHSVVLFDEVEKAHPDVILLLLQILEEGKLTDKRGRVANFANTVVILTTNVGSAALTMPQAGMGFGAIAARGQEDYAALSAKAIDIAKKTFKAELLNRLSDLVVFRPLNRTDLARILDLELTKFFDCAYEQKKVTVNFETETKQFLLDQCNDEAYGARPLRRAVDKFLGDGLANSLLAQEIHEGDCVIIALNEKGDNLKFHRVIPVSEQRRAVAPKASAGQT